MAFARTPPRTPHSPTASFTRLARIGVWVSTIALLLAIGVLCAFVILALTGNAAFIQDLLTEFEVIDHVSTLTRPQAVVAAAIWVAMDVLGVMLLWQSRALFAGLLRNGAFTPGTGLRLRRIGLILLAMAPVNILSFTLGGMVISAWATGDSIHGAVAIEDTDLYAIVVGLVITATGHMMLEAQRLSEENRSFV